MNNPQILNSEQLVIYKRTYQTTFGDSARLTNYLFDRLVQPQHFFGIFKDQKTLVSAGLVNQYFLSETKRHSKLSVGLIGGILTEPAFRKQGYAKKLLNFILKKIRSQFDVLLIQAYNWEVYAGWDFLPFIKTVVLQLPIMVHNLELEAIKVNLNDENSIRLFANQASLIYQKFTAQTGFDYFIVSDERYFQNYCRMSRDEGCAIYYNEHAYIFVRDATIYNLAFVNDEGLQALVKSVPEELQWIETTALVRNCLHHWSLNEIEQKVHAKFYNFAQSKKHSAEQLSNKKVFGYLEI